MVTKKKKFGTGFRKRSSKRIKEILGQVEFLLTDPRKEKWGLANKND